MIMSILNYLIANGVKIITVKENYRLGQDLQSKVLAFAFSISAEIERSLLSQRTTEALQRKKKEGVTLGRPKGKLNSTYKLTGREEEIVYMLKNGYRIIDICKELNVSTATFYSFVRRNKIY